MGRLVVVVVVTAVLVVVLSLFLVVETKTPVRCIDISEHP